MVPRLNRQLKQLAWPTLKWLPHIRRKGGLGRMVWLMDVMKSEGQTSTFLTPIRRRRRTRPGTIRTH